MKYRYVSTKKELQDIYNSSDFISFTNIVALNSVPTKCIGVIRGEFIIYEEDELQNTIKEWKEKNG